MRRFLPWQMGPMRDGDPDAGGGAGDPPAFDAAKFKTEIMTEVTKQLNGGISRLEKLMKPPVATPPPDDDAGGDDKSGKPDAKLNRQIAALTASLEVEKKARLDATDREKESTRKSALKAELGKHVDPAKVEAAFKIFNADVKLNDAGEVVAGADEIPLGEYLAAQMPSYEYLLPPRPVGGSGASAGSRRGTAAPSLDDIKQGMSAEARAGIIAAIQAANP